MSVIKNDARAAIPSEYSEKDPRHPHRLGEQNTATYDQIVADSRFDEEAFTDYGSRYNNEALTATIITALLGITLLVSFKVLKK